jgi:predicted DCC family thiol-disulfide oxidoreductase YuxK
MALKEILLVYDRQCPVCDNYCRRVTVRPSEGRLKQVDARQGSDLMTEITAKGLDIDQGMVLKVDGHLYYGAEAIHVLALLSARSDLFNKMNFWLFRSKRTANLVYPILRAGRNFLLKLLGRDKVNNLGIEGNEKF